MTKFIKPIPWATYKREPGLFQYTTKAPFRLLKKLFSKGLQHRIKVSQVRARRRQLENTVRLPVERPS